MSQYTFSYYVEENIPHVVKSWFGLRQKVVFVRTSVRKTVVLDLTDADVKEFFQGQRFAKILPNIIGGTMYQLEKSPAPTSYIPTTNSVCTAAAYTRKPGEEWERPSATNLCYPSDEW